MLAGASSLGLRLDLETGSVRPLAPSSGSATLAQQFDSTVSSFCRLPVEITFPAPSYLWWNTSTGQVCWLLKKLQNGIAREYFKRVPKAGTLSLSDWVSAGAMSPGEAVNDASNMQCSSTSLTIMC